MKQKTKTIILLMIGVIVSMGLISYQVKKEEPEGAVNAIKDKQAAQGEKPANVTGTFTLSRKDLELIRVKNSNQSLAWSISGRVAPKNTTHVFSEVQGKVLNEGFKLKAGLQFRAGEPLLQLDSQEFTLQLESQRSAFLNILTGMMPDLKADYPDNYQNWLNYIQSYENGQLLAALPTTKSDGKSILSPLIGSTAPSTPLKHKKSD
ncbi:hypothetical protein FNH22_00885 [Fulvivirga sp. M361]|uniref:hypothetical protein n=1 Tax=Fulvivirga sp. M361 TaxID=2594266 RepID=UPI00117A4C7C|nr:hypothetical protein [Fulvivirga sp. M361]TRX62681.1 hypothetical protein FNH22_00885 [Fulvivirga sp. M361]